MKKILTLPVKDEDIKKLKTEDIIYISGILFTGRDEVYKKVSQNNTPIPFESKGLASYHAGPIVKEELLNGQINKKLVAIGPTTSARMEKWAYDFIEKTGIKIMIGKGGMGASTAEACKNFGAIHCVYPGGCAVLGASQIEKIENCFWPELGMAECIWVLKAVELGPLIVSIDTQGNNLFEENKKLYIKNR